MAPSLELSVNKTTILEGKTTEKHRKGTELFYYIQLPRNPIQGEGTELFYYIWLPRNPISGEVTELFYYIRLPCNLI